MGRPHCRFHHERNPRLTAKTRHESTAAWHELLETLAGLDRSVLDGDRAVTDDRHIADGYRMIATTLGVAFDTYLFANPIDLCCSSQYAVPPRSSMGRRQHRRLLLHVPGRSQPPLSHQRQPRRQRLLLADRLQRPSPGAWSDRIVAIVRDDDLEIDAAGNFSFELGPTPDAAVLMTRDYQANPLTGRPISWNIEALDEPEPRHGDAETAARLRASAAWLRTMFAIFPLAVGARVDETHALGHKIAHAANQFADPYQVPDANFGWSARDACYSYGSYVLEEDEALVITTGRRGAGSGTWWCGTSSWPPTASPMRVVQSTAIARCSTQTAR